MSLIDHSLALESLGGDKNLLRELAKMFSEDAPQVLRNLHEALNEENCQAVLSEVHLLKGLVSIFFAKTVVAQVQYLEDSAVIERLEPFRGGGFEELQKKVEAMILEFHSLGCLDSPAAPCQYDAEPNGSQFFVEDSVRWGTSQSSG